MIGATKDLFETAAGLTLGGKAQKAQIISNIISQYDVDIDALDQILAGAAANEVDPNSQFSSMLDDKLKPINEFMNGVGVRQQESDTTAQQNITTELSTFSAAHEFYEDVREDMADLMEMAGRRGQTMDLDTAYKRAISMNDDIQGVVTGRKEQAQLAAKKKAAVSLIPSGDSRAPTGGGDSVRGALMEAIESLEA